MRTDTQAHDDPPHQHGRKSTTATTAAHPGDEHDQIPQSCSDQTRDDTGSPASGIGES